MPLVPPMPCRILLEPCDQFGERAGRKILPGDDHVGLVGKQRHRLEVAAQIIRQRVDGAVATCVLQLPALIV